MAKAAKAIGVALLAIGLAVLVGFSASVVRDEGYDKAALLKQRNPGNMLYESQYFVAASIRVVLIAGAVSGVLLALQGAAFLFIGRVAARQERRVVTAGREADGPA